MVFDEEGPQEVQSFQVRPFDEEPSTAEPPHGGEPGGGALQVSPLGQTTQGGSFAPASAPGQTGQAAGFHEEAPEVELASGQTDFASIKFQRENTLLTNAERYADSIREEAELYVRQLQSEIETLNTQAEQRYEEARKVKEAGEAEAAGRIAEADLRVEEIRKEAYGEGFEAGRQEGLQKRYEEAGVYLEQFEEILRDLSHFREQVDYFMEKDGVRLAVLIAKKVLNQELKINKKAVWNLLASTLSQMEGKGNFRVWLSPEDFEFAIQARPSLEKFLDEDQTLSFRSRADLPPANVMIETDREVIDLSFVTQFQHVENVLFQQLAEREGSILNRPTILSPGPAAAAAEPPGFAEAVPGPGADASQPAEGPASGDGGEALPQEGAGQPPAAEAGAMASALTHVATEGAGGESPQPEQAAQPPDPQEAAASGPAAAQPAEEAGAAVPEQDPGGNGNG